jgi:hypothetical protein
MNAVKNTTGMANRFRADRQSVAEISRSSPADEEWEPENATDSMSRIGDAEIKRRTPVEASIARSVSSSVGSDLGRSVGLNSPLK